MTVFERRRFWVRDEMFLSQAEHAPQVLALLIRHLCSWWLSANGAVTNREYLTELRALHSQALVHQQPTSICLSILLANLLAHRPGERPHADTCHPHKDAVVHVDDTFLGLQVDLLWLHLFDHGIQLHVHALAGKVVLHIVANRLVEHCQEAWESLHKRDLEVFGDLGIPTLDILFDEVRELAAKFDTCRSSTNDYEVQESLHGGQISGGIGDLGLFDDVQHLLSQCSPVLDFFQKPAVLVDARDAEGVWLRANGDHEVIVVQGEAGVTVHLLLL
mmetsp:Transcript_63411/g.148472  ORF Transcript_63411/g.148472 Transcript_63411/m.148472 type:complete len:275 (+) Transcript_63411:482-1306(+)